MSKKEIKKKRGYPLPNPNLPKHFGKLLVFNVLETNELAFELGKLGMYLISTVPIKTTTVRDLKQKRILQQGKTKFPEVQVLNQWLKEMDSKELMDAVESSYGALSKKLYLFLLGYLKKNEEFEGLVNVLQTRIRNIETCGVYVHYVKYFKPKAKIPRKNKEIIQQMETELSCYHEVLKLLDVQPHKATQKKGYVRARQMIANIRYSNSFVVEQFVKTNRIQSKRIFKYAGFVNTVRTRALFYASALNLLNLCEGKVIRIKSKHRDLRDEFYKIALEVKKESGLDVTFDYDVYDVELEINRYKTPKKVYIILTTTGLSEVVRDSKQKEEK